MISARMKARRDNCPVMKLAIPYYGCIARPGRGYETLFIIASVNRSNREVETTRVAVWAGGSSRELGRWMADLEIEGLVAGDSSPALEESLAHQGICVHRYVVGDIFETLDIVIGEVC